MKISKYLKFKCWKASHHIRKQSTILRQVNKCILNSSSKGTLDLYYQAQVS